MTIAVRYAVPAALVLAACAAAGSHLIRGAPRDPCEATPEIHACAVFLRPEAAVRQAREAAPVALVPVAGPDAIEHDAAVTGSIAPSAHAAGL